MILHAEKGLVRAGKPDLTLFHQVKSSYIAITIGSTVITTMRFIPTALLGGCLLFQGDGPIRLPHSPNHQVGLPPKITRFSPLPSHIIIRGTFPSGSKAGRLCLLLDPPDPEQMLKVADNNDLARDPETREKAQKSRHFLL